MDAYLTFNHHYLILLGESSFLLNSIVFPCFAPRFGSQRYKNLNEILR